MIRLIARRVLHNRECRDIEPLLWEYPNGAEAERERVGEHLASCATCRIKAEEYRTCRSALAGYRQSDIPASGTGWSDLVPNLGPTPRFERPRFGASAGFAAAGLVAAMLVWLVIVLRPVAPTPILIRQAAAEPVRPQSQSGPKLERVRQAERVVVQEPAETKRLEPKVRLGQLRRAQPIPRLAKTDHRRPTSTSPRLIPRIELAEFDGAKPASPAPAAYVPPDIVPLERLDTVSYVLEHAAEEPVVEAKGW
jgi:hypothetical protein